MDKHFMWRFGNKNKNFDKTTRKKIPEIDFEIFFHSQSFNIYIYMYIYILWECWSSVNHYVVMCRTKSNILWIVLNIYDRAIIIIMIINKYIIYIYLIHGKSISISFHLLNCLINVVLNFKKPYFAEQYFPWIKYIYNIYSFNIIIIYIYIYIYIYWWEYI